MPTMRLLRTQAIGAIGNMVPSPTRHAEKLCVPCLESPLRHHRQCCRCYLSSHGTQLPLLREDRAELHRVLTFHGFGSSFCASNLWILADVWGSRRKSGCATAGRISFGGSGAWGGGSREHAARFEREPRPKPKKTQPQLSPPVLTGFPITQSSQVP